MIPLLYANIWSAFTILCHLLSDKYCIITNMEFWVLNMTKPIFKFEESTVKWVKLKF